MRRTLVMASAALGVAAMVAAAVAAGSGAGRTAVMDPGRNEFLFSATEIIVLPDGTSSTDSSIARLDTRTGALYRFRGSVDNAGTRSTWEMRAEPVSEATSGMLEIQVVTPEKTVNQHDPAPRAPAVFLVDIVTGSTWILRARASSNFSWEPVEIFRSATFY